MYRRICQKKIDSDGRVRKESEKREAGSEKRGARMGKKSEEREWGKK